ncbi:MULTISPECIES: TonB-dependent receptor [unclassified Mucilaginibacter]|uniref:TonB-dependent receptor n=1 Tax=unclassified Mucilaginibacter TaxID=2617802 RepID=UPI002AC8EEF3|nr:MULTISPECIES: TonB-dependent receptor [unclassified Mucilaginibacter]MEB0262106.1 TonB-dependent receptor [Mucilaginibacter sp. 10I4]MEB0278784.1 TonB-dependent receptor [Mucilaginibacter sp. 10B2]MEB0299851.1 TonB-dependent receptor [Mucilaginibacter sp. 5C4]WPX21967.1 TonB-dependent receptor [Mucilaginibacter sp. 5C4]
MKFTSLACFVVCLMCFTAVANNSYGQKFLEQQITLKLKNLKLTDALDKIAVDKQVKFAYADNLLKPSFKVDVNVTNKSIKDVLAEVLTPFNLDYKIIDDVIVISDRAETPTYPGQSIAPAKQAVKITGKVLDDTNQPLPGVSVKLKGTTTGTVTDVNGNFVLDLPNADGTLVFSFIGFTPKEVPLNGQTSVGNIQLVASQSSLTEVVVVGYGTQKRVNVIGAIDQIGTKDIEGKPSVNLTQALQGASPNLIIQQTSNEPGAYQTVNIRGVSTFGNNNPLTVIDGITGGDLNLLNPQDIESISILKDAGSAAIYGSRAANGVILVTTKKGKKNTGAVLTYNGQGGVQVPHVGYKPVHSYENAILRNEAVVNAGLTPIYSPAQIRDFQQQGDQQWFLDAILQNAVQQNHNLSLSGGSATSTYLVSAGVMDQRSNLVGPDYGLRRYNYRMNLSSDFGRLKLTSILAYTRTEIKEHSYNTGTLIVDAGRTPTYYKIKDDQGNYLTNDVLAEFNPLGILEKGGFRKRDNDNIFGNLTAELGITKDLKIKGVFGGTLLSNHMFGRVIQVNYLPKGSYGSDRNTTDENQKNLFINSQFLAQYTKTIAKNHNIDVLIGVANESTTNDANYLRLKFTDPELGTPITGTIIETSSTNTNNNKSESSLNSVFGRASYSFKNKYYGEFDFRVDASSKFAKNYRNAFFPSGTIGYRLTEEDFMKSYRDKFGDVKIRASYGILGNQNVGDYQFLNTFGVSTDSFYAFNNLAQSTATIGFANPDIRWERASTFNVGFDATFFNNKLTLSADYFNKITRDILLPPVVPGTFGAGLPDYNAGEVQNRGWELNINYRLRTGAFNHSFAFNVGDTKNKVLKLEGGDQLRTYDEMQLLNKVGLPIGSYIALKRDGYFQNLDDVNKGPKPAGLNVQPGDNRYVDVNGDGVIDDNDKFVFGSGFPRLTFGFTYNVAVKNFDLSLFLQGVGKRDMFVRGEQVEPFHVNYSQVIYQHQLDYWTPQNPDARFPRLAASGSQSNENNFRRGSDMYIFDGKYLRVKNVQIGYTLPQGVSKKIGMKKVRTYLTGQNILTFSAMKFIDPESTELGGNVTAGGANSGRSYPLPVYYGFGIDISL